MNASVPLNASTSPLMYGWQGLSYDAAIGKWDNLARTYDQNTGTFLSQDPMGLAASDTNNYRYVWNRSASYVDPDGRVGLPGIFFGAVAGGVGGFLASGGSFNATIAGAVAGGVVGAVNPWLSQAVGSGAAGLIIGGAASAGGQIAANKWENRKWNSNFSVGAVIGSSLAGVTLAGSLAAGGYAAAEAWTFSRLSIALTEGIVGGAGELLGSEVGKLVQLCP